MPPKKSFFIVIIWVFILFVISACLDSQTTLTPNPTPCSPPTPNIYSMPPLLTSEYVTDWSALSEQQALSLLASQVERWSDYEDVSLEDNTTYRITVTLVTPDLRRAAYAMEAIHRHQPQIISPWMQNLDTNRPDSDNLLFLVTISASGTLTGDRAKIAISPNNLAPFDRHGNPMKFGTPEGAFLTTFNVVDGPYAAYITYPLLNDKCELNIDVLSQPSVTLLLKEVIIGGKTFNNIGWTINLSPLISVSLPTLVPYPTVASGNSGLYLEPKTIPPTPNPSGNNLLSLDNYWNDLSKFIWSKLSASNSR